MILFLRRVWAFVARDWRLELSYRMQFFLRILSILIVVTTLFFISKIFAGFTDPRFEQWRDPLAAWLTGLAVLNYFMTGFSSLANAIRQEQVQGTLESVLMTPISVPTVIVASSAWDFVQATFFSVFVLWLVVFWRALSGQLCPGALFSAADHDGSVMSGDSFGELRDGLQARRSIRNFPRYRLSAILRRVFPDAACLTIRRLGSGQHPADFAGHLRARRH